MTHCEMGVTQSIGSSWTGAKMAELKEGDAGSDECPLDAEVHSALERLTTQPPLAKSERLCGFLRYILTSKSFEIRKPSKRIAMVCFLFSN